MEVKLTEGGFKTNWARWHNFKKDNRSVSLVRAGSEHSQRLTPRGFKLPVPPENLSPTEKPHTLPAPPHTCRWFRLNKSFRILSEFIKGETLWPYMGM